MPMGRICRKRPCRICRRWFIPNPRLKDRQMTCGDPECKRQWHRRKCAEWNKDNPDYFKENYLQRKMENAGSKPPSHRSAELPQNCRMESRIGTNLRDVVEEAERIYGDGINIAV